MGWVDQLGKRAGGADLGDLIAPPQEPLERPLEPGAGVGVGDPLQRAAREELTDQGEPYDRADRYGFLVCCASS
jgi:hypothetical protein